MLDKDYVTEVLWEGKNNAKEFLNETSLLDS